MTEDDAKAWILMRFGSEKIDALTRFVEMIVTEAPRQNLVSAASLPAIWARHIVDSAQLIPLANNDGLWVDIGTGAGFPGIVTSVLSGRPTLLVEPRRRRVEFLDSVIHALGISATTTVLHAKIEGVVQRAAIVSARAVASVDTLLENAASCTDRNTQWLLPKGRSAREEVASAQKSWHGSFHVEQSITDPESMIVVASGVSRR